MPPRKTRAAKQAQASAAELVEAGTARKEAEGQQQQQQQQEGKGEKEEGMVETAADGDTPSEEPTSTASDEVDEQAGKMSMEERMAKMKELRKKMADSSMANRKAVASELNRHKNNAREKSTMSKKLQKAERVLDKRDADEKGEDWERSQAWKYSIEDNERWEERLEKKEEGKDQGAVDANTAAERSYRRQIKQLKPDMKAYRSSHPSSSSSSSSTTLTTAASGSSTSQNSITQRDASLGNGALGPASALSYGEHKPDDAALDRVAGHLNSEAVQRSKHSRKRAEDPDAEVNYINDKNKHFNKKIARFYDKYTKEIRDNFERGTAL